MWKPLVKEPSLDNGKFEIFLIHWNSSAKEIYPYLHFIGVPDCATYSDFFRTYGNVGDQPSLVVLNTDEAFDERVPPKQKNN